MYAPAVTAERTAFARRAALPSGAPWVGRVAIHCLAVYSALSSSFAPCQAKGGGRGRSRVVHGRTIVGGHGTMTRRQWSSSSVWWFQWQWYKHCNGNTVGGTYASLSAATGACEINAQCAGVLDTRCDEEGSFQLCSSATLMRSSTSCVYTKSRRNTTTWRVGEIVAVVFCSILIIGLASN